MKYIMNIKSLFFMVLIFFSITNLVDAKDVSFLPPVKSFELKNGAKILYVKDDLPQLTIVASFGFGKLYEDEKSAGIAELLAKTVSLGGSKKYPGKILHEKIESIGGNVSVFSSWERTIVSIKVLDRFKDVAFDIIGDLIENPNIEKKYLNHAKMMLSDKIKRKYDDPASIAFEKARAIIFNKKGYGAVPTIKMINSYTVDDLKNSWSKYITAKNSIIGIVSSIDYKELDKNIVSGFKGIKSGKVIDYSVDSKNIIKRISSNKNKIYFYKKDVPQATIVTGTIAPTDQYTGKYSLKLMNYILGGGSFNSRLVKDIRVKNGLAYAVQSILRVRKNTGVFLFYAQTNTKSVSSVLNLFNKNIEKIQNIDISKKELDWAKKYINLSYIFLFNTPMKILDSYFTINYYNYPTDYYETYLKKINKVNSKMMKIESKKLFGNGLIKVIVGKKEALKGLDGKYKIVYLK